MCPYVDLQEPAEGTLLFASEKLAERRTFVTTKLRIILSECADSVNLMLEDDSHGRSRTRAHAAVCFKFRSNGSGTRTHLAITYGIPNVAVSVDMASRNFP